MVSRLRPTSSRARTGTSTPWRACTTPRSGRKPGARTSTTYDPAGTRSKRNWPTAPVRSVRAAAALSRRITATPGTTAPDASDTVPAITPADARRGGAKAAADMATHNERVARASAHLAAGAAASRSNASMRSSNGDPSRTPSPAAGAGAETITDATASRPRVYAARSPSISAASSSHAISRANSRRRSTGHPAGIRRRSLRAAFVRRKRVQPFDLRGSVFVAVVARVGTEI